MIKTKPDKTRVERTIVEKDASANIGLVAEIVSAYVSHNSLRTTDLVDLIASVNASLNGLGKPEEPAAPQIVAPISIKKSIGDDYLISMEDGKKYRTLRRHLTVKGLSPEQYREKWGLPYDYPMVAPNYSAARSALAKAMGLGAASKRAAAKVATDGPRRGRGRPRKDAAE